MKMKELQGFGEEYVILRFRIHLCYDENRLSF